MKISLEKLNPAQAKEFLEYFKAAIRKGEPFLPSGSARYNNDEYETFLSDYLVVDDSSVLVNWKIVQKNDGSIPYIELSSADNNIDQKRLENSAKDFILEIQTSAIAKEKTTFLKRTYLAYIGPTLDGEYWLPGFRFAPLVREDEYPQLVNAERIFVVDQKIDALDDAHAHILAEERTNLYSAYLSLLLDIGLFKPRHEHRLVLIKENGSGWKSKRCQLGFIDKDGFKSIPKKGEKCKLGIYKGSVFDEKYSELITCPKETRRILRGIKNIKDESLKNALDGCARLYQMANVVGRHYPTLKLSYKVAAAEAIAKSIRDYSGSFSIFIRTHVYGVDENMLAFLYGSIRSAHWHAGEFPLGETDPERLELTNQNSFRMFHIQMNGHKIIRTAIMNWIMGEIAATEEE